MNPECTLTECELDKIIAQIPVLEIKEFLNMTERSRQATYQPTFTDKDSRRFDYDEHIQANFSFNNQKLVNVKKFADKYNLPLTKTGELIEPIICQLKLICSKNVI